MNAFLPSLPHFLTIMGLCCDGSDQLIDGVYDGDRLPAVIPCSEALQRVSLLQVQNGIVKRYQPLFDRSLRWMSACIYCQALRSHRAWIAGFSTV